MRTLKFLVLKSVCYVCLVLCTPLHASLPQQNFVTYEFSGGRFGDNLLAYLHAKWVSYRYQIPMLYKPFLYSSQLALHDVEILYCPRNYQKYREVHLREDADLGFFLGGASRLYICPYFPECAWERAHLKGPDGKQWRHFQVDWKNPEFRAILRKLISPKQQYPLAAPPQDKIGIAIHVREGGGHDTGDWALYNPTKAPPLDFYIEGLAQVVKLFPGKSLYCYLFTDALNPQQIIQRLKESLPQDVDIAFDCRESGNAHDKNVLEDFFSFFQFDVFIHSKSNFSLIPSLIHDYAVTYSPVSGKRVREHVVIDEVKFEINEEMYQQLIQRCSPERI